MRRLTNPEIGLFLALLCALALGLNGYHYWQNGELDAMMVLPTVGLIAMMAAMPFLAGWRPSAPRGGFLSCASCSTLWSPQEDGLAFCPGCGKHPKGSPVAAHYYASAQTR